MSKSVIIAGARTPIGKLSSALAALSAMELGGLAIQTALKRASVSHDDVDYVFMGQVLQAGQGQITARQAAVKAGIPMTVPATTVNKVCLSGLNAIHLADQMISLGEADIVVAGGMESMSRAPYVLAQARQGYRLGNGELIDVMMNDGLYCSFDSCSMGEATQRYADMANITRSRQDAIAALSHTRAEKATKEGYFAQEIVPVSIPQRKGDPIVLEKDEGIRPETTPDSLAKLPPAFSKEGTITAGNSSQISDAAVAVVLVSKDKAESLGIQPLGEIISYGQVAGPDPSLLLQPANAINQALEKAKKSISEVDLFEINEAFAAVSAASMDNLGITEEVCNVNGGAIALGHPIGASGTRLVLTLLMELQRRGGGVGVAALCGGGGQGDAICVRTL
ncbi:MAG: acetyl-CoA C-acetyltransferase [Actinobacteria bacterium]|jgi:acetyl-CoA C-acetyltransferase|nr:acetyl-CoA C-acetyltransferase [Actinomycetota bacterium]MCL6105594.1 acetyl-CoA C-acetyltransferase [Actinomycetota bacterium]